MCGGQVWVWLNRRLKNFDAGCLCTLVLYGEVQRISSDVYLVKKASNPMRGWPTLLPPTRFDVVDGELVRRSLKVLVLQVAEDSNLVDSARSHTLVSKIKPCMSKYKQFILWNCEWLIISVIVYLIVFYYLDNRSNSRANTCVNSQLLARTGCIY